MAAADLDDILHRVATGELSPEEAARLLDAGAAHAPDQDSSGPGGAGEAELLHEPATIPGDDPPPGGATGPPAGPATTGPATTGPAGEGAVRTVRLTVAYKNLTVIGDPAVARVHATGRHTVRHDGDALVVESDTAPWQDGDDAGRFIFVGLPRSVGWARGWREHTLTVRVNPNLPLEIDATGCALRVCALEAGARMHLIACSLRADRVRGPLALQAMSSSVKGSFAPAGTSTLSCEQSSAKVWLLPGVDLRIRATNRMGKVVLPGRLNRSTRPGAETTTISLGTGRDEFTVDALMSSVVVSTDAAPAGR